MIKSRYLYILLIRFILTYEGFIFHYAHSPGNGRAFEQLK